MKKHFTLIEVLFSIAILLIISQFLAQQYTMTSTVAVGQVKTIELYTQAQMIMDTLQDDIERIVTNNANPDSQFYGKVQDNPTFASSPFAMAFVTTNHDIRRDKQLYAGEGLDQTKSYDVGISNPSNEFKGSDGLEEIAYYLSPQMAELPTWTLHRAVRSPFVKNGAQSLITKAQMDPPFIEPTFRDNYQIAKNLLYMDIQFLDTEMRLAAGNTEFEILADSSKISLDAHQPFPKALEISVSFVASSGMAQNEGQMVGTSSNTLRVRELKRNFPLNLNESKSFKSYFMVGSESDAKVFSSSKIIRRDTAEYEFVGQYVLGSAASQAGTTVLMGHTFSRVMALSL